MSQMWQERHGVEFASPVPASPLAGGPGLALTHSRPGTQWNCCEGHTFQVPWNRSLVRVHRALSLLRASCFVTNPYWERQD